jgi:hypothetical protein
MLKNARATRQSRNKIILIKAGKWAFLGAGMLGVFFSFVAWFLVPGSVDLNRLVVAGLFASLGGWPRLKALR